MKKRIPLNPLVLLAAVLLLALGPALARANHPTGSHPHQCHSLKAGPCTVSFPESGLRAGRLSTIQPWGNINKRNPEVPDYVQKVYRTKTPLSLGTSQNPFFAAAVHSPRNFLVLRI
jgi:hypothetical protein